jgi:hypothetical protein
MSKFEKGAPRESHEFRLAPREVPPSPCGGGVEPRHHVRDRHDNGWGVVPNYMSSAAVGPEVEGATNVCVPFCGQLFLARGSSQLVSTMCSKISRNISGTVSDIGGV